MWKQEIKSIIVLLLFVFSFRSAIAEPYVVPSGSMKPNILPGDRLLVSKFAYGLKIPFTNQVALPVGKPQRGDVIVFRYPSDPSVNFVKRLIGIPGDQIEIQDGVIKINGSSTIFSTDVDSLQSVLEHGGSYQEVLGEKEFIVNRLPHAQTNTVMRLTVPKNSYFFMGDNRDDSSDSRMWGFVPEENIKGKVIGIWLSINTTDTIPSIRWTRIGNTL